MADLRALRQELAAERANSEEAARALLLEQERQRRLERNSRELERRFDERNPAHRKERQDLTRAIAESRARTSRLQAARDSALAILAGLYDRLLPLTDPREAIGGLSATYPILMFPVRLETRFVTRRDPGAAQKQLLVRVYPDDCLVDGFEPDLSEPEVTNLRRYWCEFFSAGRDETLERAAWRNLCAAHGAGRAIYLTGRYAPLAGSDAVPMRSRTSDIILCIPVDTAIADAHEKTAIANYWTSTWRAGSDEAAFGELGGDVGAARAAEIRSSIVPFNIKEKPQADVARATVPVSVVFVVLTPIEQAAVKRQAWTRAPSARLLPERFVLIADSGPEHVERLGGMVQQPLAVGPDPLAEGANQFQQSGADLTVPEPLKWMTDFETAVQAGMAFRIDLTARQDQQGFDRLYVVGLRLTSDQEVGRKELEDLLQHHLQSQNGFAILPQGTPTNNTDEGPSGWSRVEEADALFDQVRAAQSGVQSFDPMATGSYERRDGLVLAEALGIDAAVLQRVPAAGATDQAEARAMNAALWPATLGYWMDTQMRPVFSEDAIERTRQHFINRVSGRGSVPALRIGNQPYGVLPTTAFSRLDWLDEATGVRPSPDLDFLRGLRDVLRKLDEMFWSQFAATAPHIGQFSADPQQRLLDIVGLHPSSVDFHMQVLDSADRIWNESKFRFARRGTLEAAMRAEMRAGTDLLRSFGYTGSAPELVEKFVSTVDGPMSRPAIDASPLSETNELSVCTNDDRNYVGWCADKAEHAFDDLRQQVGFSEGKLPNALFYHVLRHALQLGYYDAAVKLHVTNNLIATDQIAEAYREPAFVHIAGTAISESRYRLLYSKSAAITGDAISTVADFIPSWTQSTTGRESVLADQLAALRVLEHRPTARLERAFADHIDLCSFRWDAWMLSLVNERLAGMRRPEGPEASRRQGVYLGAFGWLEDLKPDDTALLPVTLGDDVREVFDTPGQPPLQRDPSNGGHVLAPSLNHAVTAAVLRNGYLNNATPSDPTRFAVDLSSARARVALQFVEGVRNGQSLGALLGYQFERRLHDRHDEAETDAFIYQVRKAFPLVAKRITDSVEGEAVDAPIESLEARNVCDGLLMLEHVRTSDIKTYPWGKDLDRGTPAQEVVINEEVLALFDIHDAIADVALSESVHQVLMGNSERAAATMDAYAKSTFPPEPDVVRTPRNGTTLTHRVALHLPVDAVAGPAATPRAQSEPALDSWLRDVLPPMSDLVVRVRFTNSGGTATEEVIDVSMESLGLRPIDVLYLLDPHQEQAMNDLDDRTAHHVITTMGLSPDASVQIRYTEPVPGRKTAFETSPLIASLRGLLLNARPLKPSDAALESEASGTQNAALVVPTPQVDAARSNVDELRQDVATLTSTLAPLVDPNAALGLIVDRVDASLSTFIALQRRASLCGVALAGSGQAMQSVRDWFAVVRRKARDLLVFWNGKLEACDAGIAEASDPVTPESLKVSALARAERAVSTDYTMPLPATAAAMLPTVSVKRGAFVIVKVQIEGVVVSTSTAIKPLWTAWSDTFVPRARHDITVVDSTTEEQQLRVLVSDMHRQLTGLALELEKRLIKADGLIATAATASGEQRADRLVEAVAALLGDSFRILPRFTLSASQADEWQNAYNARASVLAHVSTLHDFPVDDWLYGIARVRGRMHDLEKVMQVTATFGRSEPMLDPIQLPFRPGEPWLAMEVPEGFAMTQAGEHLLYSAIYTGGGFDKQTSAHGGLLLDEWTETIPGTQETAGLAFHYDRPNSEPPQTFLLITPASASRQWQWADVVMAIPETFELAKKRAAEPRDVSGTPLARFLPATLMAFTTGGISISSQFQAADVMFAALSPDA